MRAAQAGAVLRGSRLAGSILRSNLAELPLPYRLSFVVTYRCQLRCRMCNIWRRSQADELSLTEIDRFFSSYGGFSWINLGGGEIFLREDILDIIGIIHKRCPRLFLLDFPTNGFDTGRIVSAVTRMGELYPVPKMMVSVSLDGPRAAHDEIRGKPGSWDRAVETFKGLRALPSGPDVFFGLTLQKRNMGMFAQLLGEVRRRVPEAGPEDFHVNVAHESAHYYGNSGSGQCPGGSDLWAELSKIMRARAGARLGAVSFLERRYQLLARGFIKTGRPPLPCQALGASLFMHPDGRVYPCSIYDRPIGGIRDFGCDLAALWRCAARREARQDIRAGRCPGCWTPCEAYQSILAGLARRDIIFPSTGGTQQ